LFGFALEGSMTRFTTFVANYWFAFFDNFLLFGLCLGCSFVANGLGYLGGTLGLGLGCLF